MGRPVKPRKSYDHDIQAVLRLRSAVSLDVSMNDDVKQRVKDAADVIVDALAKIESVA